MQLSKNIYSDCDKLAKAAIDKSVKWAEINTGSYNLDGLANFIPLLKAELDSINIATSILKAKPYTEIDDNANKFTQNYGNIIKGSLRPGLKKRILLMGHADTVFPISSSFQKVSKLSDNILGGPGLADMKGGLAILFAALQIVEEHSLCDDIGIDILINSDEEIGSLGSYDIIYETAKKANLSFIVEPVMVGNYFAKKRAGSGNFTYIFKGRSAHAGREIEKGRNAIISASKAIIAIDEIWKQFKGLTLNIAKISGGKTLNSVPDQAVLRFNLRSQEKSTVDNCLDEIQKAMIKITDDTETTIEQHGNMHRPIKIYDKAQKKLEDYVSANCKKLNIEANWLDTNGVCDGNIVSSAGCAVVDTLGVCGGNIHTEEEYVELDSYYERTLLLVSLLANLNKNYF